jgi:hypothetical protein
VFSEFGKVFTSLLFRDLLPENVLLGPEGNIKVTFCSEWSCVDSRRNLDSIEELYSAPGKIHQINIDLRSINRFLEVGGLRSDLVTDSCDWWSLGPLLYQLQVVEWNGCNRLVQCKIGDVSM